jgi:hypothetical protein
LGQGAIAPKATFYGFCLEPVRHKLPNIDLDHAVAVEPGQQICGEHIVIESGEEHQWAVALDKRLTHFQHGPAGDDVYAMTIDFQVRFARPWRLSVDCKCEPLIASFVFQWATERLF